MTDTDYQLIQCPNGHDLQAAKADMHKRLACPVCEIHFVPAEAEGASTPATPPVEMPYGTPELALGRPEYPGTTEPLRYLWLFSFAVVFALNLISYFSKNTFGTPGQTPAPMFALIGCSFGIAVIAACIVQLMWIYRIHADAQKYGKYSTIPAWAALAVSFIPFVNLIWTAVIMKLLSNFADERVPSSTEHRAAFKSASGVTTALVVISVVWLGLTGVFTYQSFGLRDQAIKNVKAEGITNANTPEFQRAVMKETQAITPKWMVATGGLVPLIAGITYFIAVRRLVDALYPALGAPIRE